MYDEKYDRTTEGGPMTSELDDPGILETVRCIFEEKIAFNGVLGLRVESLDIERPSLRLDMSDELIGNYFKASLHGGVVAATLDAAGGLVAFLSMLDSMHGCSRKEKMERFSRMGTIDLRIDYLRPGLGRHFLATGYILRMGTRVAVTRMELTNDEEILIAVGTGAYQVG
jgi:uncharacterized protein (TIGR00369 family)